MDQGSTDFYKNLVFATPYLVAGFFISIIFNYFTIQAGSANSVFRYSGWPLSAGSTVNGEFNLNLLTFSVDVAVWTIILAVVAFILVKVFVRKEQ